MSDEERRKAEHDEAVSVANQATQQAHQTIMRSEFAVAAGKLNVVNVDAAFKLAEGLSVDASGKVHGVDKALQDLKKTCPFLFAGGGRLGVGGGNPPSGGGGQGTENQRMNDFIRRSLGR